MANYYFLATVLPPLSVDTPPELSLESLLSLLKTNLTAKDWVKVQVVLRYHDVLNIRNSLSKHKQSIYGNLSAQELAQAVEALDDLPMYMVDFLTSHDSIEAQLRSFSLLLKTYYLEEATYAESFLKQFLRFEYQWRLVLAALRAKDLGRDLLQELQLEEQEDAVVQQLIAQKDAASMEPPTGFEELKSLYEQHKNQSLSLAHALVVWHFDQIEAMLNIDLFSIHRILGYLIQFISLDNWFSLNKQQRSDTRIFYGTSH